GELLQVCRRPVHRKPLFRRGRRHRGEARQRYPAARAQLVAVPAVGAGPLHRSVAALFSDQPVLVSRFRSSQYLAARSHANFGIQGQIVRWTLEPISKSSEEDNEAGELEESEEVLGVILPADEDAALPLDPRKEAFDEPTTHVAA